jgi:phenylacetate-CoA ligase
MLELGELLASARAHPLYRDWDLRAVHALGDSAWRALPTLRKEHLIGLGTGAATSARGEVLFYSSGTTGQPKLIHYSQRDLNRIGELCARFCALEGIEVGARVMVLLPMALWAVGRITMMGLRQAGAHVFPIDVQGGVDAWQRWADVICPDVISSTPSVLTRWAPHYYGPAQSLVETTGEPLLSYERVLIESAFGGKVYDAYGLSECVVGVECGHGAGFHYWDDAVAVEVLDPASDMPLEDGDTGEIVVTNFMQEALPVLRFRTGDLGRVDAAPCACGLPTRRAILSGRLPQTYQLTRGVQLSRVDLDRALTEAGAIGTIRFKGRAENPAAAMFADSIVPTFEISIQDVGPSELPGIENSFLASLPELAELILEDEARLILTLAPTPCREAVGWPGDSSS